MNRTSRRPSPALLVAVVALVAGLAGSATALPGKNTIDKNDIKKKAVKTKALANNAVKSPKVADGTLTDADIADSEPRHIVGAPGEPAFSNGGEGDCIWMSYHTQIPGWEPVSFFKDQTGIVHLTGAVIRVDGPGGDGACDGSASGEEEDHHIFTLPGSHSPVFSQIQGVGPSGFLLAGAQGVTYPSYGTFAAGLVVYGSTTGHVGFDGTTFRTDAAGAASAPGADKVTRRGARLLERLMR
jgi:hypothetical protein